MKSLAFTALSLPLIATSAAAVELTRQERPQVYHSAFLIGRGDTGIADADNEDSLFYNPAGLALFDRPPLQRELLTRYPTFEENINPPADDRVFKRLVVLSPELEASRAAADLYKQGVNAASMDALTTASNIVGQNLHAGANEFTGLILRRIGFGVYGSGHADALIYQNPNYGGLETAAARVDAYSGVTAGGGQDFLHGHLLVGASLRTVERALALVQATPGETASDLQSSLGWGANVGQGSGFGGDLGAMGRTSPMALAGGGTFKASVGLLVRDVGGTHITPKYSPSPDLNIPQTVNAGVTGEVATHATLLRLALDTYDVTHQLDLAWWERAALGGEAWLTPNLGLTAGLHDGYPCGGLFADFTLLRLDGGTYTEELGDHLGERPDRRYFARLTVGF